MKFLFLSEENLKDSFFIKDLVYNMPKNEKVLVLHEHFPGTLSDTRFVTKRISALLSEAMVYNLAFSGDQRKVISLENEIFRINEDFIHQQMKVAQVMVLNPIAAEGENVARADALSVAKALVKTFEPEETFVFARNTKSLLASGRRRVEGQTDFEELMKLFEEEQTALLNALALSPATIASPVNFAK